MQEVKLLSDLQGLTQFGNLPQRNDNFVDRNELFEKLEAALSTSKPVVVTALHGLGGVGKTQLVVEYAYRKMAQGKYQRVMWISAENESQIEAAFIAIGNDFRMGIIPEKTPSDKAVEIVKAWLTRHPKNLMIFDNAPDDSVKKFFLESGADIFITSHYSKWAEESVESIVVGVFTPQEARDFYIKIVGEREKDKGKDEDIRELCEELGRLPLALAHAFAYIRQCSLGIQAYLKLYRESKAEFLKKDIIPEGDDHVPVYVTWDITMARVRQESQLATLVLDMCSFLHSEKIPTLLLEPNNDEKKTMFIKARNCLGRFSMVSIDERDQSVTVHKVVQEVTRLKLSGAKKIECLELVYKMIFYCYPYGQDKDSKHDDEKSIEFSRVLLPHVIAVSRWVENNEQKLIDILFLIQHGYFLINDPQRECEILRRIVPMAERRYVSGNAHSLIAALSNLGVALGAMGDVRKKRFFLEKALDLHEKCQASQQSDLSSILSDLANAHGDLGNDGKKIEFLQRALKIVEDCYGTNNFRRLKILGNLGNAYSRLHNFDKALETLEPLLPLFKEHYGEQHPEYAQILANVSNTCLFLGDNKKAYEYSRLALKIRENFYKDNPNHPKVAEALRAFGSACFLTGGNASECRDLLERARTIYVDCFGADSREIEPILCVLIEIYRTLGDETFARSLGGLAHEIILKTPTLTIEWCKGWLLHFEEHEYEDGDPTLEDIYQYLGEAYLELDNLVKAREVLEKAVDVFSMKNGCHLEVAKFWDGLGIIYHKLGESQKGCEVLEKALKIKEAEDGENKKGLSRTLDYLIVTYDRMNNFPRALEVSARALSLKVELYGRESSDVAATLNQQGNICFGLDQLEEALKLYEESLQIFELECGADNMNACQSAMNAGRVYWRLGYLRKACDYLQRALVVYEFNLGVDHPDVAKVLYNLGWVYFDQKRHSKAIKTFSRAYKIVLDDSSYGQDHPVTAAYQKTLQNAILDIQRGPVQVKLRADLKRVFEHSQQVGQDAIAEYRKGNYKKSLELFLDVEALYQVLKKKNYKLLSKNVATLMWNLGNTYKELGSFKLSLEYLNDALNIWRSLEMTEDVQKTAKRIVEVTDYRIQAKPKRNFGALQSFHAPAVGNERNSNVKDDSRSRSEFSCKK